MGRLTNWAGRLLRPPAWVLALVTPASAAALACVFATGRTRCLPAYLAYLLSAYCLTALLVALPGAVRRGRHVVAGSWLVLRVRETRYVGRCLSDPVLRARLGLCQGAVANVLYAVGCAALGVAYSSAWYVSLAAYTLALGGMRAYLAVCYQRRAALDERKCLRRTAWLLILLTVPLGGMVTLIVIKNISHTYPSFTIYLCALYTFYSFTIAIINLAKHRKLTSPILSASRVLSFVSAVVSVLGLQASLISRFSAKGEAFRIMMNSVTGGFVCGAVLLAAVCMLVCTRGDKREVDNIGQE